MSLALGCSRSASTDAPNQQETAAKPQALHSVITTISRTEDGQTLVEIPLGRDHGLTPGTLIRVMDPQTEGFMKGMLQVLTVAEAELSLARQIGLLDRNNPIAIGDPVLVISDVRELAISGQVRNVMEGESQQAQAQDTIERQQFTELRRNFTNELQTLSERHQSQLQEMEQRHQQEISDLQAAFQRRLERREAEHLTELSAVREALADEAVSELRRDREARGEEIKRLTTEKSRLLQQTEGLASQLALAAEDIRSLRREQERLRSAHEREIRAELETREILEQRIRELEVRLGLPGSRAPAVLVGDVGREETVLARLDRISRERSELLREVEVLRRQASNHEKAEDGEGGDGTSIRAQLSHLQSELGRTQARLEALRERQEGMELARLSAERSFFDLASQVLRLPSASPSVNLLQEELREQLHGLTAPQLSPATEGARP
ncbi:MAG: hypothetical protein EA402_01880 [Planctomycetota bacterium]|nr:MAG: hypothetical protein EA402_01880 [Planctomycetota bacterium]